MGWVCNDGAVTQDPDAKLLGRMPGLDESHFAHDGLITKQALRAVALAALRPLPGELLWDLGTGAGSIAVEWCRAHPDCRAIGVERRADRAANARINAGNLTLGQLEVLDGDVMDAVAKLPKPDAVFIGGGASQEVVDACIAALSPGGRLVIHGVTIETETLVARLHAQLGGELMRVGVESADAIGRLRGWSPARTVVAWRWVKPTPALASD